MHPNPNLRHPQDSEKQRDTKGLGALQALSAGLGVTLGIGRARTDIDHLSDGVTGIKFSLLAHWKEALSQY